MWKNEAVKYRGTLFFGKLLEENLNDELKAKFKYTDKPKVPPFLVLSKRFFLSKPWIYVKMITKLKPVTTISKSKT